MTKDEVLTFIKGKKLAVISTSGSDKQPESALIGFGETDNFELIFGTYKTTRKYKNLKKNNKVAFVIGWDENNITVQYEGTASVLEDSDIEKYVTLYHEKVPDASKFKLHPDQTYWMVKPKWVRYSDLSGDEEKVIEFTFKANS